MDRNDVDWQGYFPASVTPFTEKGALDLDSLRRLVDFYVSEGMHGVLVNGTCGEWFAQSAEERRLVAEAAVSQAAGRLRVLVGCTAYTAAEAAEFARHALAAGADGVVVSAPPYAKLFPNEVIAFFEDLNGLIDGAITVYNWPHGTGIDIDTDLAVRLAAIDQVVAIKDSTPNIDQFLATSRAVRDQVRVFGPYMSARTFDALRTEGGDGTIGGGSLSGRPDPQFWESYWAGDLDRSREYAIACDRLFDKLWLPGGWAGKYGAYQSQLKALMRMLGQPGGDVRRPRLPIVDPASLDQMRRALVDEGLLATTAA